MSPSDAHTRAASRWSFRPGSSHGQSLPVCTFAASGRSEFGCLISTQASQQEVRQAFRRLALLLHPDRRCGSSEDFLRLKEAADTLLDPVRRAAYDEQLAQQLCLSCEHYVQASMGRAAGMEGLAMSTHPSRACAWVQATTLPANLY